MSQRTVGQLIKRQVVQVAPQVSVRAASQVMAGQHVGAVLVMEDGRLDGIFTERDVLNRVLAEGRDPDTTPVAEVMTPDPVTLSPQALATDALRLMSEVGFRHVPIVEDGAVHGIISLRDFVGIELQLAPQDDD